MQPHKHIAISTLIGALAWWGTGKPAAGAAALVAGVLPDIDHIADYSYYYWRREHRLILPLHSLELAALGAGVALRNGDALLGVAALSYLVHLLADQLENRVHLLGYSLLFRASRRFRLRDLSTVPDSAERGRMDDLRMLKNLLARLQP